MHLADKSACPLLLILELQLFALSVVLVLVSFPIGLAFLPESGWELYRYQCPFRVPGPIFGGRARPTCPHFFSREACPGQVHFLFNNRLLSYI